MLSRPRNPIVDLTPSRRNPLASDLLMRLLQDAAPTAPFPFRNELAPARIDVNLGGLEG